MHHLVLISGQVTNMTDLPRCTLFALIESFRQKVGCLAGLKNKHPFFQRVILYKFEQGYVDYKTGTYVFKIDLSYLYASHIRQHNQPRKLQLEIFYFHEM